MATLLELSRLAGAVYGLASGVDGWSQANTRASGGGGAWDGFQAAAYTRGNETIVAFRGTEPKSDQFRGDLQADASLWAGMNSAYFSAGEAFAAQYLTDENTILCGHSLGGAIAQVVGNRHGRKFATFNAPGVAVLASRNVWTAHPVMLAVRMGGSVLSALWSPMQAYRDVRATFKRANGVNVCLNADLVSQIGVHYGDVIRIPGTGLDPRQQHGMAVVIDVLQRNPLGGLTIDQAIRSNAG